MVPAKWLLFRNAVSKQQFQRSDVSSFFRVNGYPPDTSEYNELLKNKFDTYKLKIYGLGTKTTGTFTRRAPCDG